MGLCNGIEIYSRHLSGRTPGEGLCDIGRRVDIAPGSSADIGWRRPLAVRSAETRAMQRSPAIFGVRPPDGEGCRTEAGDVQGHALNVAAPAQRCT